MAERPLWHSFLGASPAAGLKRSSPIPMYAVHPSQTVAFEMVGPIGA
jgi:hypothetical protein